MIVKCHIWYLIFTYGDNHYNKYNCSNNKNNYP